MFPPQNKDPASIFAKGTWLKPSQVPFPQFPTCVHFPLMHVRLLDNMQNLIEKNPEIRYITRKKSENTKALSAR